jgi:molybdopterin-guanine dinucleotide biosynthesis protein A
MESVLAQITTPYALFVPCDMPALPRALGDRLLRHAPGVDGVAMKFNDRVEPFPSLLSAELAPTLKQWVAAGERKADLWLHRSPARVVPYGFLFPEDLEGRGLANVNDPDARDAFDWQQLE